MSDTAEFAELTVLSLENPILYSKSVGILLIMK